MSNCEWILDTLDILLRIVAVGRTGRAQDRGEKGAIIAQSLAYTSWESNWLGVLALLFEVVADILAQWVWLRNEDNIVLLRGSQGIVVEVVNDEGVAVGGEVDIEFEEERNEGGGSGIVRGKC